MNKDENGRSHSHALKDLKFIVATRMLDHIGVSMYSKYPKAIGELVVNGYDADANYVSVQIKPSEDKIIVEDNGEGMDEQDIREGYMFLGSGQKRAVKRTAIYNRLPIGNKGIGKLAGFGIARRIEVKTTKNGKTFKFHLDRDELEDTERMGKLKEAVLDRASMKLTEHETKDIGNGTIVVLRKLRPECGKLETDKVIAHLAHELPLGSNFQVVVNGLICAPKHIPASRTISINHEDPVCGRVIGDIMVVKKMLAKPGVFTTVRGRVVGEPSLFSLSSTSFTYHVGDLITGSIEVAGFDPEDKSDDMPVIKTDREGFVETHPKFVAYSNYMTRVLMDICREEEKKRQVIKENEKKAKVDNAIKQVAEDLNSYDQFLKRQVRQHGEIHGEIDDAGITSLRPDLSIETRRRLDRNRKHIPIRPELMREIRAAIGVGKLHFGGQTYEIKTHPLGQDFPECDIRYEQSLILVNVDHPAYDQGVEQDCIEITVFRAIAARFAEGNSESPEEMYERLDQMIRFHARRTKDRRERQGKVFTVS